MSFFNILKKNRQSSYHSRPDKRYSASISIEALEQAFSDCADFSSRKIYVAGKKLHGVSICYIDGLTDGASISDYVLRPLTDAARLAASKNARDCMDLILHGAVYGHSLTERSAMDDLVNDILRGFCAIVFDHARAAITFETKSSTQRSISEPTTEKSVKGPKDSFVETLRPNTALVRKKLCNADLKIQETTVGRKSLTKVAIFYIAGLTGMDIVETLKERLDAIDIDGLIATGSLEEYISDNPLSPFPQLIHTERPDKFAMNLLEGRAGVIVDGMPIGFLLPVTFSQLLKVPEDNSLHFLVSSALTFLRHLAFIVSIMLPAFYVAVAMYHQEMIPLKILLSVIQSKQQVPFTTAAEILGMLLAFELLQEAGLRLPSSVGQTLSIIGALIVGQSAVQAKVLSPITIIVVALAGICGYTTPNQDLGAAIRICRFLMVLSSLLAGMFGVMVGSALLIYHMSSLESFGVPYMSPICDGGLRGISNVITRPMLRVKKYRESALNTQDKRNQK